MRYYSKHDRPLKCLMQDAIWALSHKQRWKSEYAIWGGVILHMSPHGPSEQSWREGIMLMLMVHYGWITIQHALPGFPAPSTYQVTRLGYEVASDGPR